MANMTATRKQVYAKTMEELDLDKATAIKMVAKAANQE